MPNNYFRLQGYLDTFTFDDGSPESTAEALEKARALAARYRTPNHAPAVLVWRETPGVRSLMLPLVGRPLPLLN